MSYIKDVDFPRHTWDTPPFHLIASPTPPVQSVDAYAQSVTWQPNEKRFTIFHEYGALFHARFARTGAPLLFCWYTTTPFTLNDLVNQSDSSCQMSSWCLWFLAKLNKTALPVLLFDIRGTQSPPTLPYRCLTLFTGFLLIKVWKVFLILIALSQEQQLIIVFTVNPLTVVMEIWH